MNIFFTSDHHFGHDNIRRHCNRPFETAHEMNVAMTENWNSQVGKNDLVYHMGDFSFRGQNPDQYAGKLNGKIHLLRGNHDRKYGVSKSKSLFANFEWVKDYYELKVQKDDNQLIVLSHYPFMTWKRSHYGSWMFHGHCHGGLSRGRPNSMIADRKILDVGVDTNNFFLYSYDEVKAIMDSRKKND